MSQRTCKDCGNTHPETREFFGNYKNNRNGVVTIGWRNQCRECMRQHSAAHSKANPDQKRKAMDRRLEREESHSSKISEKDISRIRKVLNDTCRYCSKQLRGKGEVDHLTPVGRGGSGNVRNLTLACMSCNREKLSKTLEEYIQFRKERDLPFVISGPDYEKPDKPSSLVQRRSFK